MRNPSPALLVVAPAILLAACTPRTLDLPGAFACDPAAAGVDMGPAPPTPAALSDLLAEKPPPVSGGQSADAVEAKRLFDAELWGEAEPLLRRVARGEDGDDRRIRQRVEHDLGVTLYYQGRLEESLTIFLSISANPDHERHAESSVWLFKLAQKGNPYLDRAARALALYPLEKPPEMVDSARWQAWWGVLLVVGRYHYRAAHFDAALQFFARVPPRSEAYDLARGCVAVVCARANAPAACGPSARR